jgi:hypothetical protein
MTGAQAFGPVIQGKRVCTPPTQSALSSAVKRLLGHHGVSICCMRAAPVARLTTVLIALVDTNDQRSHRINHQLNCDGREQ